MHSKIGPGEVFATYSRHSQSIAVQNIVSVSDYFPMIASLLSTAEKLRAHRVMHVVNMVPRRTKSRVRGKHFLNLFMSVCLFLESLQ